MDRRGVVPRVLVALILGFLSSLFTHQVVAEKSANILLNADFSNRTNLRIPDYWDIHHAAVFALPRLYEDVGMEPAMASPVQGAGILRIRNPVSDFQYLALASVQLAKDLPNGIYTFSVYLKSDRERVTAEFSPAWDQGRRVRWQTIGTEWRRFSASFRYPETFPAGGIAIPGKPNDLNHIQPLIYLPDKATYYIAAPQLEIARSPTSFRLGVSPPPLRTWDNYGAVPRSSGSVRMVVEFDRYWERENAKLSLLSSIDRPVSVQVTLGSERNRGAGAFTASEVVPANGQVSMAVPLTNLAPGSYQIDVKAGGNVTIRNPTMLVVSPTTVPSVRVNQSRRILDRRGSPYFIRGMAVGGGIVPQEWYFRELSESNFNTVFYTGPLSSQGKPGSGLDRFIERAEKYNLGVIVGPAIAGAKPSDWRKKISDFVAAVEIYADESAIVGWYPIDEPSAFAWNDAELQFIYREIRRVDPGRIVFSNWAYDGVPQTPGKMPRGTLASTDVYSFSDYPYAVYGGGLGRYAHNLALVGETANEWGKPAHSWLQLYSGFDAWREPSVAELRYLVYLNLVERSMFSFWEGKSTSEVTWNAVRKLNREAKAIALLLHENPKAQQRIAATNVGSLTFSVWAVADHFYVIAVCDERPSGEMHLNLSSLVDKRSYRLSSLFGPSNAMLSSSGVLTMSLLPLDAQVVVVAPRVN